VVNRDEEALHGTACNLIFSCELGFKTVLEEGSIAVTRLNCPAVFIVKRLIYIANAVGLESILFYLYLSLSAE
jgi:hypothetical protein